MGVGVGGDLGVSVAVDMDVGVVDLGVGTLVRGIGLKGTRVS